MTFRIKKLRAVLLGLLLLPACAINFGPPASVSPPYPRLPTFPPGQKPYEIDDVWYFPLPSASGYVEEGLASWYGEEFHERPTSSGETYNMYGMSAAHKILPLGTAVKVTHLESGRSVVLKINDRGPFVSGRIIDLSYRAAQLLGMVESGTVPVRVEAVQLVSEELVNGSISWKAEPVPDFRYGNFAIQIGAFENQSNACRLKETIPAEYDTVYIKSFFYRKSDYYRVQVGRFQDLIQAYEEAENLKQKGFADAFVVAVENGSES